MNSTIKVILFRFFSVILIIAISIGFGFSFDAVCTSIEKKQNPMPGAYIDYITEYSEHYGVPEHIIYAIIKIGSNFDSDAVSEHGEIGLMQIQPDTFKWITTDLLNENLSDGMLYAPEINIKYGVCYLSYLYDRYGIWDTCFAAYQSGIATVDLWCNDIKNTDENGILIYYPDEKISDYVNIVNQTIEIYKKLYF